MNKFKKYIYNLVEKGSHGSKVNLYFDYSIVTLIMLNVMAMAIETLNNLHAATIHILRIFEIVSIIIFSLEYIARIYISDLTFPAKTKAKSILKFILSPYSLIDLLAILPFYLPFILKIDLRFLRLIRLIRFFGIFKLSRYNTSLKLIKDVFKEKRGEIGMTFFIAFLLLLVSGFIMYLIENPAQPEQFPNVFASLWWAVATLTTVGYGDIAPITPLGKVVSSFVAFIGIGLIALPTGIISAGFIEKFKVKKHENKIINCPHCSKAIHASEE
jgi:voltage-gated potassium channel